VVACCRLDTAGCLPRCVAWCCALCMQAVRGCMQTALHCASMAFSSMLVGKLCLKSRAARTYQ
jgi:hypothetical protein